VLVNSRLRDFTTYSNPNRRENERIFAFLGSHRSNGGDPFPQELKSSGLPINIQKATDARDIAIRALRKITAKVNTKDSMKVPFVCWVSQWLPDKDWIAG
jgi:hypothetical protein